MSNVLKDENLYKVLLGSHVSEKSTNLETMNQHVFKVASFATKDLVKKAVEKMFNVKVEAVRILHTKAKVKQVGQIVGKRKTWKKAYVKLKDGDKIDLGTNVA